MSASVEFDDVSLVYPGSSRPAVDSLCLDIEEGEFLVLVGPSGCGKSTSLRILAGLEPVSSGKVLIGQRDVSRVAAQDRDVAMVFQNYALYPHMTVAQNLAFALKIRRLDKQTITDRINDAARLLDLTDLLERKPKSLSGGQRQRVAMGRAIVRKPQVFLMDEPLSNLDARLRVQMRSQIADLQRRLGVTTIYVTHDQVEALTMGHRVAVLKDGRLQQVATPREIYDEPVNAFVATFIGSPSMNLFEARLTEGGALVADFVVPLANPATTASSDGRVVLGVRPEALVVDDVGIPVRVHLVEDLGSDTYLYGLVDRVGAPEQEVTVRSSIPVEPGSIIRVRPTRSYLFSPDGAQERIG